MKAKKKAMKAREPRKARNNYDAESSEASNEYTICGLLPRTSANTI